MIQVQKQLQFQQSPLLIKQTIYQHFKEPLESSSEISFLKMSLVNSTNSKPLPEQTDLYLKLEATISKLQSKEQTKLIGIRKDMTKYESKKRCGLRQKKIKIKDLIEIDGRGQYMMLEKDQQFKECFLNFQVDENLNYVREQEKQNKILIQAKNLQTSKKLTKKQNHLNRTKIIDRQSFSTSKNNFITKRTFRSGSTSRASQCNNTSRDKKRVYQQILSLFSTTKLLAMQKR